MAAESRLTIVHRVCAWCRKEFGLDTWSGRVDVEITTWGICSRCLRQESARERAARKEERRRTAPPNSPSGAARRRVATMAILSCSRFPRSTLANGSIPSDDAADFLIVRGDPLADITAVSRRENHRAVFKGGRQVV